MSAFDQSSLDARTAELANKQRELADREAMAQAMADERQAELERWQAVQDEHRMVQNMLEDVRGVIARLTAEPEFLETNTNMFMSLSTKLKSFEPKSKQGLSHGYGALFTLLAQMLEKNQEVHADQSIVEGIMGIIDRIEENLDASLSLERDAERQRAADYVELEERI